MTFSNKISVILTKKNCPSHHGQISYTVVLEVSGETASTTFTLPKSPGPGEELLLNNCYPLIDKGGHHAIKVFIHVGDLGANSTPFFSDIFVYDPCNYDAEIFFPVKEPNTHKALFHLTMNVKLLE
jgi:hypothetical protein